MSNRKPDAEEIERFIDDLKMKHAVDGVADRRVGFLFHVTDVHMAVSILSTGALLSRASATQRGLTTGDNASHKVIRGMSAWVENYARLYFRPRTPTFWHNEGFKSQTELRSDADFADAHCPIPVALLFDAKTVLTMSESRFSSGTLAAHDSRESELGQTIGFLRRLAFSDIYHDQSLKRETKSTQRRITHHRQAEVVVPDALPLMPSLKWIYVRSEAERQTMMTLIANAQASPMPPDVEAMRHRMVVDSQGRAFHAHRLFIKRVRRDSAYVDVTFNIAEPPFHSDSYTLHFHYSSDHPRRYDVSEHKITPGNTRRPFHLPAWCAKTSFDLRIEINEQLAYLNRLEQRPEVSMIEMPS